LNKSQRPLFVIGNGIKQSKTSNEFKSLCKKLRIPFLNSRFALDLYPYSMNENMGLLGIKGSLFGEKLVNKSDLIISLGCRIAPTLALGNPKTFLKNKKSISINNDADELRNPFYKFNLKINTDLKYFFKEIKKFKKKIKAKNDHWLKYCKKIKLENDIPNIHKNTNPIDLYRFMYDIGEISSKKNILITDAGSNYYIGGQAWRFERGQLEIASTTNAAMGLSIPLSIGASIASKKQILSITGDGSIELNIQELKTISHYNLNIKTFVINNGGYVSMKKWQDDFFKGNRLDTEEKTGVGTMDFKKIANAFNLNYISIKKVSEIKKVLKIVLSNNKPYLIDVFTDPQQRIYGKKF
jgi:acetolactate synthase I/II/III large subunit